MTAATSSFNMFNLKVRQIKTLRLEQEATCEPNQTIPNTILKYSNWQNSMFVLSCNYSYIKLLTIRTQLAPANNTSIFNFRLTRAKSWFDLISFPCYKNHQNNTQLVIFVHQSTLISSVLFYGRKQYFKCSWSETRYFGFLSSNWIHVSLRAKVGSIHKGTNLNQALK